jgi:hypothetical protein
MKQASWTLAISLIVISGASVAQNLHGSGMVTEVPFEFVVGNKIMPAGTWSVHSATIDNQAVLIRNSNARIGLFSSIMRNETVKAAGYSALLFKRYGGQYFLSEIRLEGSSSAYCLPESRAEAELRAKNVPVTERILLAAAK